jgi:hypothetical protein
MVNKWGQLDIRMQDLDSSEDVITIIPQEEAIISELNAYFSTIGSVKEATYRIEVRIWGRENDGLPYVKLYHGNLMTTEVAVMSSD